MQKELRNEFGEFVTSFEFAEGAQGIEVPTAHPSDLAPLGHLPSKQSLEGRLVVVVHDIRPFFPPRYCLFLRFAL